MNLRRTIQIDGDLALVPLTRGYVAIIDAADVPLVDGSNWSSHITTSTVYAQRSKKTGGKREFIRMHRLILEVPSGMVIDHINGNGLDNRRSNLRIATVSQNLQNQRRNSANTSGFKGVAWCNRTGRWQSKIKLMQTQYHLGRYDTPEEAHAVYCEAARRLYGDFANPGEAWAEHQKISSDAGKKLRSVLAKVGIAK